MSEIKSNIQKTLTAAEKLNETLNAFLSVERENALARADEVETSSGENQSLRGFAVAVKDNICTRGMQTS